MLALSLKIEQFYLTHYMTLSGATSSGQSGPGSVGSEGVPSIPQSSSITGASQSHCLVSYMQDTHWGGSYPSAETQCILQPLLMGCLFLVIDFQC